MANDIISSWLEYMDGLPTSPLFSEWAGVFIISAAVSRRAWFRTSPVFPLAYPNLYVCLVGPPGCGKDVAINPVADLLREANDNAPPGCGFYLGEESLSAKGLIDSIASDEAKFSMSYVNGSGKEQICEYHSLIGCVPELGTLIPEYEMRFISNLNELYNCKTKFSDRIRGQNIYIANPHVALLLGTQPDTLARVFPESTFNMGFTSRIIFVSTSSPNLQSMFKHKSAKHKLSMRHSVLDHVTKLMRVSGEFSATDEAEKLLDHFHLDESQTTLVEGSRFAHYNTRRSLHLVKLSMLYALAESTKLLIEPHHVERAKDLLFRTEALMPGIFHHLTSDKGFHTVVESISQKYKTITQGQLIAELRRTHPPYAVPQIIRSMIDAGELIPGKHNMGEKPFFQVRTLDEDQARV